MKIAVIQLGYTDDEAPGVRAERVWSLVEAQKGQDLVILPELWGPTGFGYEGWLDAAETVDGPTAQLMSEAARDAGVTLHAGSIVERGEPLAEGEHGLWNTSLVFGPDGELKASYRKIHRFGFGAGEPKLMDAGQDVVLVDIATHDGPSVTAALSTCYDLRFPELYRRQLDAGAEMFLVPAAWPMPRVGHWTTLGRARAIENQCVMVQCNTAGTHAGHQMGGHSQVVAADGTVLAEAKDYERVLHVELDPSATAQWRTSFPVLDDRRL